jgi:cobalt-zinc-cadmium resistance protein CzcA
MPEGYHVTYGGQFENLQSAQARLRVVVPAALLLILLLLYFSFGTVRESLLIFSAIPFAAVGGVLALWLRGMPFSISAGVGFIALFGVAVLNGMVLVGQFQQLERAGVSNLQQRICEGVMTRFRPVLMTASVASLGFLPMAIAQGAGAEVQKPLATVVIGGLISATFLTLVILPVLYAIFSAKKPRRGGAQVAGVVLFLLALNAPSGLSAQQQLSENEVVSAAFQHHPALQRAQHAVEEKAALSNANLPLPPLQAYTWLPFNPEVGVTQNFDNPLLVRADRRVRKQETTLAQTQMSLTAQAVQRQVTLAYDRCVYLRDKAALLRQQDSLLADYLRAADLEYRTGNISALAQLSTQTRSREAHRQALSTAQEYRSALRLLQLQAGLADSTWQPADALGPRALVPGDTALLSDWCAQRRQLADLDLLRQQKKTLPGFALGVVTNVDPYNRFLPNAYFGVNVPLFRKGYRAEEEAATARQKMALDDCNLQQQEARQRREQALHQWQVARSELDYWAQWGQPQAALLLNTAEVSRRAGEIGSTEYLLAVQQAFALQLGRVESLHLHNQAAIEAAFWMVP